MKNNTIRPILITAMAQKKQRGFTLVELMVALALSLLVVAAAVSALLVSRQGFTSVDAASQLRDNTRFATDFITRLSVQSGFKDVAFIDTTSQSLFSATDPAAALAPAYDTNLAIFGFNNAIIGTASDPLNTTNNSRDSNCSGTVGTDCANGSDILVMRYQTAEQSPGSNKVDNAMFNCAGVPQNSAATSISDNIESLLYVFVPTATSATREPTLMCKYRNSSGATWANAPTPLVQGVESFQVLYGTDGVVPNTAPVAGQPDTIPERYLRADELTVAGNDAATKNNWRRVRSLRIGLVVRGPVGSAQDTSTATTLAPLGVAFANTLDKQSTFTPIPSTGDGRARQVVTFTVYLHNSQGI